MVFFKQESVFQTSKITSLAVLLLLLVLSGCAHKGSGSSYTAKDSWIQATIHYQQNTPSPSADLLNINQQMRDLVHAKFPQKLRSNVAVAIANWLVDEDGYAMQYAKGANLTPIEAFQQKRGNCLSFTMLLVALGKELDIEIQFNAVDIPDTYGLDEELGMVYYRHINGVLKRPHVKHIFDLAMGEYDTGYPQRVISEQQAMALFYNNLAIDALGKGELQEAQHRVKTSIALSPDNADLWVNLGVVLKRSKQPNLAKKSFQHAFNLDRNNAAAASNLERFYREQGSTLKAATYLRKANRARRSNPYYHYQTALDDYRKQHYRNALRSTKRAITLHNKDPRFFELKSLISQQQHNYKSALKSLDKAHKLASNAQQRGKYATKANLVLERAINEHEKRQQKHKLDRDSNFLRDQLRGLN